MTRWKLTIRHALRYPGARLRSALISTSLFVAIASLVSTSPAEIFRETVEVPDHLAHYQVLLDRYAAEPELRDTKSSGWKPLQRALWFAETRPVAEGASVAQIRQEVIERRRDLVAQNQARGSAWFSVGPTRMSGRCLSVDFHPTDPDIIYVGSASGGVWKSLDGGDTYAPITDDLATLAAGAVCVLAWNPDIVLLGTGEGSGAGYGPFGIGIYRSTDGGATWNPTSLGFTLGSFHGFNVIEDNPTTQTILAGSSNGLYRSTDDGATWSLVEGAGNFFDIKWKPDDANVVYVTKGRDQFTNMQTDNGVKKSTDDGLTFALAGVGQPVGSSIAKTKIAVTPDDPQTVYAHYVSATTSQTLGIYRSTDAGATWGLVFSSYNMTGGQGWYNLILAADPDDAETVVTGGVNLYRSTNGGVDYTNLNQFVPFGDAVTPHWDEHFLGYRPGDTDELWLACDGGVWKSTDDGATWISRREGLITYQFYDICVSQSDPTFAMGGTQDNGIPGREGFDEWFESNIVVDGMVCNIAPDDADLVYGEWQNGNNIISFNGGGSWFSNQNGLMPNNGIWTTPVDLDPADSDHLYTMSLNGIFRTTNGGNPWVNVAPHFARWISISPVDGNLVWTVSNFSSVWRTTNDGANWIQSVSFPLTGTETKIHAHPTETNRAFVTYGGYGGSPTRIVQTTNSGASWFDVTGDFPAIPANTFIIDPDSPDDWYVGADMGVWHSSNGGVNWTPFGSGLANATIVDLEIQRTTRKLVAGSHGRGVWETDLAFATSDVDEIPVAAQHLLLDPPYPNPVRDETILRMAARTSGPAQLQVFDSGGRLVSDADEIPGDGVVRMIRWHPGELPSGVYFAVLSSPEGRVTQKLVVER